MTDNISLGQLESILTELLSLVKSKKAQQFRNYTRQVRKLANEEGFHVRVRERLSSPPYSNFIELRSKDDSEQLEFRSFTEVHNWLNTRQENKSNALIRVYREGKTQCL